MENPPSILAMSGDHKELHGYRLGSQRKENIFLENFYHQPVFKSNFYYLPDF